MVAMERPIIFNAEMVIAILEGRKTETRRVVKPQPPNDAHCAFGFDRARFWIDAPFNTESRYPSCDKEVRVPYPLDCVLWVRETWQTVDTSGVEWFTLRYRATPDEQFDIPATDAMWDKYGGGNFRSSWRPSIFMPRWASRLLLRVEDVQAERLHDITADGARSEGVPAPESKKALKSPDEYALFRFSRLWDEINVKRGFGWDANPWVWVIKFELLRD
jgi:hypothetical protein